MEATMADELNPAPAQTPEEAELEAEWKKYFRPKSVTWWVSVIPLIAGLLLAFAQAFAWLPIVALITTFAPGATPSVLVYAGLMGIGLRGAIK
jgi:lysylphosphatidylglycerol synthetase-like protein (DUF2156 family)